MMHKIDKCRCRVQEETSKIIDGKEGATITKPNLSSPKANHVHSPAINIVVRDMV